MRQRVIEDARRRSKEEALTAIRDAMAAEQSPGTTVESILEVLDEARA